MEDLHEFFGFLSETAIRRGRAGAACPYAGVLLRPGHPYPSRCCQSHAAGTMSREPFPALSGEVVLRLSSVFHFFRSLLSSHSKTQRSSCPVLFQFSRKITHRFLRGRDLVLTRHLVLVSFCDCVVSAPPAYPVGFPSHSPHVSSPAPDISSACS